jgi:hypothetical protein
MAGDQNAMDPRQKDEPHGEIIDDGNPTIEVFFSGGLGRVGYVVLYD